LCNEDYWLISKSKCHRKKKVTIKQIAKHVYIEQQIHSPNFTAARTNGHLNFVQKSAKNPPSSS